MKRRRFLHLLPAALAARSAAAGPGPAMKSVLEIAREFPAGGGYNTAWKGSGCPEAVAVNGTALLAKGTGGTYCSGFTFAVAARAAAARGLFQGVSPERLKRFQKEWYGAVPETAEKQCVTALENLGIGAAVALDSAEPGDFIQLWRVPKPGATRGSGHSVVLVRLVVENGKAAGIEYLSSQQSTDGIGVRIERFADAAANPGGVDRARTHAGRLKSRTA